MRNQSSPVEELIVSRPLSWPALFMLGVFAGILLGLSTGLPFDGDLEAQEPIDLHEEETRRTTVRASADEPTSYSTDAVPAGDQPDARVARAAVRKPAPSGPKIAIIIDDLGIDAEAFHRLNAIDASLTLSFLPYAEGAQSMIDATSPHHEVMLHLPMEPQVDKAAAGPGMLRADDASPDLLAMLDENLGLLSGYVGVNNHTGSKLTEDAAAMEIILGTLHRRGLYFLDSLTTADSVVGDLAKAHPWRTLERDVFLDAGGPQTSAAAVRVELDRTERIARRYGEVIAIGHPYPATLTALEEWVKDLEGTGLHFVTASQLLSQEQPVLLAQLR